MPNTYIFSHKIPISYQKLVLTFHNIDNAADIALLDDQILGWILHRIHAVDDFAYLHQIQILHKVIIQNGRLDKFTGAGSNDITI